jgi:hypothetical protein
MKVGIYTAIYGGYETPKKLPNGVEANLYTDNPDIVVPPGWTVHYRDMEHVAPGDPMMQHKWWKTHPLEALPDCDVSLWIDGSMEIIPEDYINRCLAALGDDDWATVRHPHRFCIYTEGEYSATLPRYWGQPILDQINFYRSIGHPEHWGLHATGANARRHTDLVEEISDLWWQECVSWSHQDQLSLPVLFRLRPELKWNYNLPWHVDWLLHPHG